MIRIFTKRSCVTALRALGTCLGIACLGMACSEGGVPVPTREPFVPNDDDSGGTTGTSVGTSTADTSSGPISLTASASVTATTPDTTETAANTSGTTGGQSETASEVGGSELTGAPEQQPATGWWSHCTSNDQCTAPLFCVTNTTGDDGFCTDMCTPAGIAASCGGTANVGTPGCITIGGGVSLCTLNCATMGCPEPMVCISDTVDSGPVEICF